MRKPRTKRTDADIRKSVEAAFKPLRCVAEILDYNDKLGFRIFDEKDKAILRMRAIPLRILRDDSELQRIIEQVREAISEKRKGPPGD